MTGVLSDPQVERYSRQILLAGVGGRGQARLLAGRLLVAGSGEPARTAAVLAARAGVGNLDLLGAGGWRPDPGPDCRVREVTLDQGAEADVVLDLSGDAELGATLAPRAHAAGHPVVVGALRSPGATLATLIGRPCVRCFVPVTVSGGDPGDGDALAAPLALALAALAANEALLALLAPPAQGRLHVLDLGAGTVSARLLAPSRGCSACGGHA